MFFLVLGFLFLLWAFPVFRCIVFHPFSSIFYFFKDFFNYFWHKSYNFYPVGELVAYVGLFGRGKTLSAVRRVVSIYHAYDGKKVWCPRRKKMVIQRVKVISNVHLQIPHENLISLEQIVADSERKQAKDDENDTLTLTLVLGDEFAVQMNNREFRTNIDPLLLNSILTCRHSYLSIYYTAQRFQHVDALLRQVTSYVVDCDKIWRFQVQRRYSAWDMENAVNVNLIKPYKISCFFIRDSDFAAYDTYAVVGNLTHQIKKGKRMTEEEILKLQYNPTTPNMDGVARPSRRWLRSRSRGK